MTDQYEKGTLKLTRGMKAEEALEAYIVNELGKARDRAGIILQMILLMILMLEKLWLQLVPEVHH